MNHGSYEQAPLIHFFRPMSIDIINLTSIDKKINIMKYHLFCPLLTPFDSVVQKHSPTADNTFRLCGAIGAAALNVT
jgi:hypothetical protein